MKMLFPTPTSPPRRSMRVAILGNSGQIRNAWAKPADELFFEAGQNTGNLAIWFAVARHIDCEYQYFNWSFDPEFVKQNFDCVLFVASNQLNPEWDLEDVAINLERCDRPLIVVGLGAQAGSLGEKVTLRPGTARLLGLFSERSVVIGMRGEFSADVARRNGARNVEIVGCPSNFINASERHLGRAIAEALKTMKDPYRLSINLDFTEHLAPVVQRCISWMEEWGGFLVTQSPLDAIQCAMGTPELLLTTELERYAGIMLGRSYDEAAKKFLRTRLITFFDTDAWLSFVRTCRLAIGTRLHGNILALQAGIPAVIIPHDSRTRELAETIRMPIVESETVVNAFSLPDLLSRVEFDGEAYDQRRAELAATYVGIFEASGVPVTRELKQLATAPAQLAGRTGGVAQTTVPEFRGG